MYDNMYTRFNLNFDQGRNVESGSRGMGGVRNSVDAFVEESGSPYTLYLPAPKSHIEDPLSATIGISRMVNDNKEVSVS
jgi:hypothetical protein